MLARHRRRGLLITSGLASLALGYVFLVFLPGQLVLSDLRSQFRERQMFIVQSERLRSVIRTASTQLSQAETYCDNWHEASRLSDRLPEFFGNLTSAAVNQGLIVVSLTPESAVEMATLRQIPFHLTLQGSFGQLFTFLGELEKCPEVVWVTDMVLTTDRGAAKVIRCELDLVVFADNPDFSN